MTTRELLLIGFLAVLFGRVICDWKRIAILKRFALQHGLLEPKTSLWWNNKASLDIEKSLPAGPMRTQVRILRGATWVFQIGYGVVLLGIFHYTASMNTR